MELVRTRETSAITVQTNIQSGYLHCDSVTITFGHLVERFTQD